jgi:hypothetical protein
MKTYKQFITENINDTLTNYNIIKVDYDNLKNYLIKYNNSFENLKSVSENEKFKKYIILLSIQNNEIIGYFYKFIRGDENYYDDGYIESKIKGLGSKLLLEMKKYGSYTTFCNIKNFSSLKMHLKAKPKKIICITDSSPDKDSGGKYYKNVKNNKYQNMLNNGLSYSNVSENCELLKNGKVNNDLINFVLNNNQLQLIYNNNRIEEINLKFYFLY